MRATLAAFLSTLPLVAGLGCSADPADDPTAADQALGASYGGLTESAEAPAFGDPAFDQGPLALADVQAADAATDGRPELQGASAVRVLLVWGYLQPRPDATAVVDWSGSVTATNGALRVLRRVRFEANDTVIRPRTDIHAVAFVSHTKPAADGLLLEVLSGPRLNPTNGTVTLTFVSAPTTQTITLAPGERRSAKVTVDAAGHVFAYHIVRPDSDGCAEGFLRGQWKANGTVAGHEVGVLRGKISSSDGTLLGTLRGVFGERKNGKHLFFAKAVGEDGAFRGLMVGSYGDGEFAGRWLLARHVVGGVVRGKYEDAPGGQDGGFVGRWSQRCGEAPDEGTTLASDDPAAPDAP